MRPRVRARRAMSVCLTLCLTLASAPAALAVSKVELTADLDGHSIVLANVSRYYCHDLDYPRIHCFGTPAALNASPLMRAAAVTAAVSYVTVFDGPTFSGTFLVISQNYDILALIGWNDRISSFVGKNSQHGSFYGDWFGGGSGYAFCCNQQTPILGSRDNTFSSVYRT